MKKIESALLAIVVLAALVILTACPQPPPPPATPPPATVSPASPSPAPPPPTAKPTVAPSPSPSPKPATPTTAPTTPAPKPKPTPEEAKLPEVSIESPKELENVLAGDIKISIKVANFNIVNKLGATNTPGEGHIHYYLDVAPPTTPGQRAVTAAGTYAATAANSHTWANVKPGGRVFAVQLVNNDHTPLAPPVVADVRVNVQAPTGPVVKIISPSGRLPAPGDLKVTVEVSNFNVVNKLGQPIAAGEGHIHYYLDVDPPTSPGQRAVTAPGTYAASTAISHTWTAIPAGRHKLGAQLVNNDHTPLSPPIVSIVEIEITSEGPSVSITSPKTGDSVAAGPVKVSVQLTNFKLTDKLGQPNVAGEGHIHYFVDVDPPTAPDKPAVTAPGTYAAAAADSYTWQNVAGGSHTFAVELVNNNHTPLVPPVTAKITVTVTGPGATPKPATPVPSGPSVRLNIAAVGFAFNPRTISVAPGANVSVVFNNSDPVSHNIAVYEDAAYTKEIFKGQIISGPSTTAYQFTAPAKPGSYYFRCDVHPAMTGSFTVSSAEPTPPPANGGMGNGGVGGGGGY
ncbi:MAG: cupredoxin domain-containing protein [Chloroflexi bacterium]|nr:cupredoxin domain-containing protein [Chloroflexota bacterium]